VLPFGIGYVKPKPLVWIGEYVLGNWWQSNLGKPWESCHIVSSLGNADIKTCPYPCPCPCPSNSKTIKVLVSARLNHVREVIRVVKKRARARAR